MCDLEKKSGVVIIRVSGIPFLTSAILRMNFIFSLVYGSLHKFTSPSNYKWGKWPAWA